MTNRNTKPSPKIGLSRIKHAFLYSCDGLKFAIKNVTAFQQEVFLYIISAIVLYFLPLPIMHKGILFFANTMVLIAELFNSAIEAVVDMASPDYHVLAKRAKDLGSAAVLIALLLSACLWAAAIWMILNG
ncbi:MAG TPA: diacylglycerol kinase [Nitrospirae bacterium]|nr:diacylglycerol kinase [bacterium BMS3Abin09]GBE41794.1 diacylglycerol kinase [bacterium BMS3Bbin09]HDH34306.1 diacylglycerol kinase [Nitrospirota bacterium]HDN94656.1 diacylglycerol kinase [Nitrospirota bacterium]HDO67307.1 diacylglycerol kinase [Nitrospirota bacterium]